MTDTSDTPSTPDAGTGGPMDEEPVAILTAALIALVNAGVIFGNVMDWYTLSEEQTAALVAFITAVAAVIGVFMRLKVYSPATVRRLLEAR